MSHQATHIIAMTNSTTNYPPPNDKKDPFHTNHSQFVLIPGVHFTIYVICCSTVNTQKPSSDIHSHNTLKMANSTFIE